ncbi:hypothetical protein F4677DRAFT_459405 [Hypoxylon crocopeplum]|nr:hypothetical protein F4677DRAFT_459405 [Hypoxylon crocopeplum]
MATQSKPQSFEDHEFFPSFRDCPEEHAWDDRYLVEADPGHPDSAGTNWKHWCLLRDIIQADTIVRPRIVAKDHKGDRFVVGFYPDDPNDMPRILKNFTVGNTIVIFYPLVHHFLDRTIGVRVDNTTKASIVPLAFQDVIQMNKEVIKYTPAEGSPQKCHGCDEPKENFNKCARCTLFHYCNRDCQTKAWNEKHHKTFCKALKDNSVRYMHFLNYGTYDGSVVFA